MSEPNDVQNMLDLLAADVGNPYAWARARTTLAALSARIEGLEKALHASSQALTTAGVYLGNPAMGEGPRDAAFTACVETVAANLQILPALSPIPAEPR